MKLFDFFKHKVIEPTMELRAERELEHRRRHFSEIIQDSLASQSFEIERSRVPVHPKIPVQRYTPPKGVAPASHVLAMDDNLNRAYNTNAVFYSGLGFPGFPYLTELTQISEYRDISERVAAEMTRKWIKLRSTSDDDKSDTIAVIESELKRLGAREVFRRAAELDGFMGRAMMFLNLGEDGDKNQKELETPLLMNRWKIKHDSLKEIKIVEPITTYPYQYNSGNPLAPDYYRPSSWYVFGKKVHTSRFLTFVSRPLPDLLKPVYNFSGMSLSQLAQPYVDYWLSTRDSVGKLLRNFSTTVLKTQMANVTTPGAASTLLTRARVFTQLRDNQGLFLLDKDSEDLMQINTPLSGLADLQAQAQEHMAAVAKTPLVVLLGISPKGLNASSEGEMQTFYAYVGEQQEKLFRSNLEYLLKVIQLSAIGQIDDSITFDFVPLYEMTAKELALIRKSDAEAGAAMIAAAVISPQEERERIANDPESGYDNLDVDTPDGVLQAAPLTPKSGAQVGAEKGASMNAFGGNDMAQAIALDEGWRGNQHTGPVGGSEHLYLTATKMSGIARRATNVAHRAGHQSSHMRAVKAHQRALDAHTTALVSASSEATRVHNAYIEAHKAAINAHQDAATDCAVEVA